MMIFLNNFKLSDTTFRLLVGGFSNGFRTRPRRHAQAKGLIILKAGIASAGADFKEKISLICLPLLKLFIVSCQIKIAGLKLGRAGYCRSFA